MKALTYDEPSVIARFGHCCGLEIEVIAIPKLWGYTVVSKGAGRLLSSLDFLSIDDVVTYVSILRKNVGRKGFIDFD